MMSSSTLVPDLNPLPKISTPVATWQGQLVFKMGEAPLDGLPAFAVTAISSIEVNVITRRIGCFMHVEYRLFTYAGA